MVMGDRRGGQGQDVDVRAHLLEPLFVLHAKMLLFVDHQQAKVLEPDGLGEQRVGANDDVDRSICNTVAGQRRILCAHKARQGPDIDGKSAKPLGKALVVLSCQKRCRGDDRHLHTGHGRDKGRPDRHLCLAKAHVATDQPVHGRARVQIGQHVVNCGQLVVGFRIGEPRKELVPHAIRRAKRRGGAQRPFGGHADEPLCHLADALFQAGLLGLPCAAAQPVQKPLFVAELRQKLDILDRQVKL